MIRPVFALFLSVSLAQAALETVEVRSTVSGKLHFAVAAGRTVTKGEPLFVIDPTADLADLAKLDADRLACEAEIAAAKQALAKVQADDAEKLEAAELEVRGAQRALEKFTEADQPMAEQAFQQALRESEWALKIQTNRFNARDKLLAEGFIRQDEYEEEELKLAKSQLAVDTAKAKLAAYLKHEKPQMLETCTQTLAKKRLILDRTKKECEAALAGAQARVELAEHKRLPELVAARQGKVASLESHAVLAPCDGVVTPAPAAILGAAVSAGQPLATIAHKR